MIWKVKPDTVAVVGVEATLHPVPHVGTKAPPPLGAPAGTTNELPACFAAAAGSAKFTVDAPAPKNENLSTLVSPDKDTVRPTLRKGEEMDADREGPARTQVS